MKEKYRKFQNDMMISRGSFEFFGIPYDNDYNIIIQNLFSNWCEEHDKDENKKEAFEEFTLSDTMNNKKHQQRLKRIRDTTTQELYYQYYLWEYFFRDNQSKDDREKAVKKAKKQWERNFKRYNLEIYGVENNHIGALGGEDCPLTNEIIKNGYLCESFLEMI